jgi:hypothetical protein
VQRAHRVGLALRAEVVGVVVRVVHDRESGQAQVAGKRGRGAEGVAVLLAGAAFAGVDVGEGALEVAEDDVAVKLAANGPEVRRRRRRHQGRHAEHGVADGGDLNDTVIGRGR